MVGFPLGAVVGFGLGAAIKGPRWVDVELGSVGETAAVGLTVRLYGKAEPNTRLEQTR
jgi:hypothetical protein